MPTALQQTTATWEKIDSFKLPEWLIQQKVIKKSKTNISILWKYLYLHSDTFFLIVRIESYLGGIILKGQPVCNIGLTGSIFPIKAHLQRAPVDMYHLGRSHFCIHVFSPIRNCAKHLLYKVFCYSQRITKVIRQIFWTHLIFFIIPTYRRLYKG